MEGYFLLKDSTLPMFKGNKRKCRVTLLVENQKVVIQYCAVKMSFRDPAIQKTIIHGEEWLVFLTETKCQRLCLTLVKQGMSDKYLSIEAKNENKASLKVMEQKIRKTLRVISYDVVIRQTDSDLSFLHGVLHIFPDKLILTSGFPPNMDIVSTHSLSLNTIEEVGEHGLWFSSRPDICIYTEHRENILRTLQGCVRETPSNISEQITKRTMYVNLSRPLCYIYMNKTDGKSMFMHNYANMFNLNNTTYQNWKNCQRKISVVDQSAPPVPPRRQQPVLPPRTRNKLPTCEGPYSQDQPVLDTRELQLVLYSSKPIVGHFWVIQLVFMRKDDESTFQRIKSLEEDSDYQLLKPLPELIKISSDLEISLDCPSTSCCSLRSDEKQVVLYDVVKDMSMQSCWLMVEFHLEHDQLTSQSFHGKIILESAAKTDVTSLMKKYLFISTNFKPESQQSWYQPTMAQVFDSLGIDKYLELCNMLDISSCLGKDWMGLAGEVGLTVDEVFKIQSKVLYPSFSPTNEVLCTWFQKQPSICNIINLRDMLTNMKRFDILEII